MLSAATSMRRFKFITPNPTLTPRLRATFAKSARRVVMMSASRATTRIAESPVGGRMRSTGLHTATR